MVLMVGQGDVPDGAKTPRRKCKRESGTEGYGGKEREKVESPRIVWIQRSPLNRPLQAWPKPSAAMPISDRPDIAVPILGHKKLVHGIDHTRYKVRLT